MAFTESMSSDCSAHQCPVKVVHWIPAESGNVVPAGGAAVVIGEGFSRQKGPWHAAGFGSKWAKRGCAQCAHLGLRIRLYRRRTGPDWGGFRGRGGLAGVGTRFESHLGHNMTPLQRGFCINVWTLSLRGSL